jgi:ring-1,2-phenylacetyl-CoA epoxidase subunit PaaE
MSPEGRFTTGLPTLDDAHLVGIAAGSGITPMMAVAHTVLAGSDTSRFTLIYTNRSTLDVMFLEELADLKDRYPARLAVHHVLSREQQDEILKLRKAQAETRKQLKNVRKELTADIDSLGLRLKIINIALVPVLVVLFGLLRGYLRRKRA